MILVYDSTGTIIDYNEKTYYQVEYSLTKEGIKPYLARSISFNSRDESAPQVTLKRGCKVRARVLDFKINEE